MKLRLVALALAALPVAAAQAQNWPARPVTLVAPSSPGSTPDTVTRLLAQKLTEQVGQQVIAVSRVGASGNIGSESVAKAAPDGYTLLLGSIANTLNPHFMKGIGFSLDELAPVSSVAAAPDILAVHPSVPANNLRELLDLMKAKPGRSIAGTFDLKGPNDKTPAGQCVLEILHAPEPDGITAAGIRLGANATGKGIPSDAGGQYCIVCSGDVVHEGKHYPRLSLILVEAGEAAPVFAAGDQGAEILTVQFPRATARLGSDPKQLATRDMNALYHLPKTWLKDDVKH